jgi:hypothetical protein
MSKSSCHIFLLFLLVVILSSCSNPNCSELPYSFESYENAIERIQGSTYEYSDNFTASESSWINSFEYFSCDGVTGYLIMHTGGREYLHSNVPIEIWLELMDSDSKGEFYNSNLRGKFQMETNSD